MTVTLYRPNQEPTAEATDGFRIPQAAEFTQVPPQAVALLGCTPDLVDVLATGANYVVYSVFVSDEEANPTATRAVAALTGVDLDVNNEDELLHGLILIITS